MTPTLYASTIPPFLQILKSMSGLIEKAAAHCAEHGVKPETLILASFAPDMLPFGYQVKSTIVHSIGAIEGIKRGSFSPDESPFGQSFAELADAIATAREMLAALAPEEIDAFIGKPMRFTIKGWHADYSAEDFLLSFSMPNFYFHAATAYGLLRTNGVAIGKIDFLGPIAFRKDG